MKYNVRLEFIVTSSDFCKIEVEAESEEEARKLAPEVYQNMTYTDACIDFWAGSYSDSQMDLETLPEWEVEEV